MNLNEALKKTGKVGLFTPEKHRDIAGMECYDSQDEME